LTVSVLSPPHPVSLPSFTSARRQSVRPLSARGVGFDAAYDSETLFYDVFWGDARGAGVRDVVALGPPLRNLDQLLVNLRVTSDIGPHALTWRYRSLDRHMQIHIVVPEAARTLCFASALGTFNVALAPRLASPLAGKRVLMTQSKNNALHWIADWARYHRDVHGVDAILLYDNASTEYALPDIRACLETVAGVVSVVVPWPFKYGPQGLDATRFWDSDYCQHGMLEHARRCYLTDAKSVINADIDELVVSPTGESVCVRAEASWTGLMRYRGRWVIKVANRVDDVDGVALQDRRHLHSQTVLKAQWARRFGVLKVDAKRCPPKWCVVPARCPDRAQWRPHVINGWPVARLTTSAFSYRHFRELSNGWKYERAARETYDPDLHELDTLLVEQYARVQWSR
jgi:hypothetical protein